MHMIPPPDLVEDSFDNKKKYKSKMNGLFKTALAEARASCSRTGRYEGMVWGEGEGVRRKGGSGGMRKAVVHRLDANSNLRDTSVRNHGGYLIRNLGTNLFTPVFAFIREWSRSGRLFAFLAKFTGTYLETHAPFTTPSVPFCSHTQREDTSSVWRNSHQTVCVHLGRGRGLDVRDEEDEAAGGPGVGGRGDGAQATRKAD